MSRSVIAMWVVVMEAMAVGVMGVMEAVIKDIVIIAMVAVAVAKREGQDFRVLE